MTTTLREGVLAYGAHSVYIKEFLKTQEHERVLASVPEAARPLLEPHFAAMEARLRPGASVLTWASMNIDGYLYYAHQVFTGTAPH